MKTTYRNLFLALGIATLLLMLYNLNLTWEEASALVRKAGFWLPACVALWLFIYLINAFAWSLIIRGRGDVNEDVLSFWHILKYTVTGYALNYVTPAGVLGGEPYRIMELKPVLGTERAVSCVLLNSMMHILSHFCFWAFCLFLVFVRCSHNMNPTLIAVIALSSVFVVAGLYVFFKAYQGGVAERSVRWLVRLPLVGKYMSEWTRTHLETLQIIDKQIIALHQQNPWVFWITLLSEFGARVLGCLELLFVLSIFADSVSFVDCIMMQGFSSLVANLLFFIPMQLGVREACMALFTSFNLANGGYGMLAGLVIRIREIVWITIGLCLMKMGNLPQTTVQQSNVRES